MNYVEDSRGSHLWFVGMLRFWQNIQYYHCRYYFNSYLSICESYYMEAIMYTLMISCILKYKKKYYENLWYNSSSEDFSRFLIGADVITNWASFRSNLRCIWLPIEIWPMNGIST